jgi:predicted ATP-binding protein involved in virulence
MKLKKLNISGFKSFSELELDFNERMNVILGINGAGKSTILQAIAICLSWYIARIKNSKGNGDVIKDNDINQRYGHCNLALEMDNQLEWSLFKAKHYHKNKSNLKSNLSSLTKYIDSIDDFPTSLPVIALYGVNRVVSDIPIRLKSTHQLDIFSTYHEALHAGANFRSFFEWFKEREDIENEKYRIYSELLIEDNNTLNLFQTENDRKPIATFEKDPQLEAVRKAIVSILPEYKSIKIQRSPRAIIVEKGNSRFNMEQLSDGEKGFITLIGDIARRLAIANPNSENPLHGDGIILIDEIELHLHPSWQIEIIPQLRSTFPNCQFIITTHSPLVLSSIKNFEDEKLIPLKNGQLINQTEAPYGKQVQDLLFSIFDVKTIRNIEVQEKFDLLDKLFFDNQWNSKQFDNTINWLKDHIDNDSEIARYELEKLKRLKNAKNS